ncbi:MAG: hypothetical protein M0Q49_11425, partial [Porticoccaceae bacterium]|nr:hypothetical protein [Porticoccaceae bacterium]
SFSPPSHRDIQRIGPALARIAQFLTGVSTIKGRGALLTEAEQREIVVTQINHLGLTDMPLSIPLLAVPDTKPPTPEELADPEGTEERLREGVIQTLPRQIQTLLS